MDKKRILWVIVAALILLGVATAGAMWGPKVFSKDEYSVVNFRSGELYIGKLSFFPSPVLSDVYILTVTQAKPEGDQKAKSNFQLVPLRDTVWSPQKLKLNMDQVTFYGPLSPDSRAALALKNAKSQPPKAEEKAQSPKPEAITPTPKPGEAKK